MADTVHAFDLADGWCHAHRAYCDMARLASDCDDCGVRDGETHLPHCLVGAR